MARVCRTESDLPTLPDGWIPFQSPNSPFWLFRHPEVCPLGKMDLEVDGVIRAFKYRERDAKAPRVIRVPQGGPSLPQSGSNDDPQSASQSEPPLPEEPEEQDNSKSYFREGRTFPTSDEWGKPKKPMYRSKWPPNRPNPTTFTAPQWTLPPSQFPHQHQHYQQFQPPPPPPPPPPSSSPPRETPPRAKRRQKRIDVPPRTETPPPQPQEVPPAGFEGLTPELDDSSSEGGEVGDVSANLSEQQGSRPAEGHVQPAGNESDMPKLIDIPEPSLEQPVPSLGATQPRQRVPKAQPVTPPSTDGLYTSVATPPPIVEQPVVVPQVPRPVAVPPTACVPVNGPSEPAAGVPLPEARKTVVKNDNEKPKKSKESAADAMPIPELIPMEATQSAVEPPYSGRGRRTVQSERPEKRTKLEPKSEPSVQATSKPVQPKRSRSGDTEVRPIARRRLDVPAEVSPQPPVTQPVQPVVTPAVSSGATYMHVVRDDDALRGCLKRGVSPSLTPSDGSYSSRSRLVSLSPSEESEEEQEASEEKVPEGNYKLAFLKKALAVVEDFTQGVQMKDLAVAYEGEKDMGWGTSVVDWEGISRAKAEYSKTDPYGLNRMRTLADSIVPDNLKPRHLPVSFPKSAE